MVKNVKPGKVESIMLDLVVLPDPLAITDEDKLIPIHPAIVWSVDEKNNVASLLFPDGAQAELPFGKLLVLKSHKDIMLNLIRNWNIPTEDFQLAIRISNLMHHNAYGDAIELANKNDHLRTLCMENCDKWVKERIKQMTITGKRLK